MTFLTGRRFEDYLTQSSASESLSHSESRAHVDVGGLGTNCQDFDPTGGSDSRSRTSTDPVTELTLPGMSQNCHSSSCEGVVFATGALHVHHGTKAADMYARACRRWYGDEAKSVVSSKIGVLEAKGDHKGVKAWTRVHRSLESQELRRGVAEFGLNGLRS